MRELPPLGAKGVLACAAVVLLAAAVRLGYLATCCDWGNGPPALAVQGEVPADLKVLMQNLREHHTFAAKAPLADEEEPTAHVAPGYPWLVAMLPADADVRWLQ